MPGGVIQLSAVGAHDLYLTSNPKISFFKNVYKRYTNFSMELIKLDTTTSNDFLIETEEKTIEFKIDRNGDLFNNMYFIFTLPDIYSDGTKKFKWINRIGEYIIKEVSFTIGNRKIDTLYGQWLHIWNELTIKESKYNGYNRMIGNISDLYNPLKIDGSTYPASSDAYSPSIKSRKIVVPIPFWFTYNPGLSIPLIALQYDDNPKIEIKLRPFNELYTVIDSGLRKKSPNDTYNLGKFTSHGSSTSITTLDINPSLDVNYVFLDTDERKRFATEEHEYLINQIQLNKNITITPSTTENKTETIELQLQHPVSHLVWVLQRSDIESRNQFHNYTNWSENNKDPIINPTTYDDFAAEDTINSSIYNSLKNKDILKTGLLKLNGVDRFSEKNVESFSLINSYQHMNRIPEDGIYSYSFGINYDMNNKQPNGSCNMSRISKIELLLKTCPSVNSNYVYNVYIYGINYNILKILGGMGDVAFSN